MKVYALALLVSLISINTYAKPKDKPADPAAAAAAAPTANPEEGEKVDVSKITEKYWAQGQESELGVVQNRKFTSAGRFELEGFLGTLSSDPFLSSHHYGLSLGYHFNQYFSLHGMYWRTVSKGSDALSTFESGSATTVDTNMPSGFWGVQANYNFLYGKASLFGKMIIYVDLFLLGGMGSTNTESGSNITPFVGIGQKIHLNKFMALTFDYRIMRYNEMIRYKTAGPSPVPHVKGQDRAERSNTTDAITVGLSFFY